MNTETKKVEMPEPSEAELDQVNGANAFIEGFDRVFVAFLGGDKDGKGHIHHMIDSGAHY